MAPPLRDRVPGSPLDSPAARVALVVLTALAVVVATAGLPLMSQPDRGVEAATYSEFNSSEIVPERVESGGRPQVQARNESGLVVIDKSHANKFTKDGIQPLVSAITAAGYDVEYLTATEEFDATLRRADAFVVIDPTSAYSKSDVDRIEAFVDRGGRLLMLGEPLRSTVSSGLFSSSIVPLPSRMAPLSNRFGISFGSGYLFNMYPDRRDGNYQNVFATGQSGSDLAEGIDTAVLYTSTHVESTDGTEVLVAAEGTRNVRGDTRARYATAVRDGNVFAVGDSTFVRRGNYEVQDNEVLLSRIAEFLTGGERTFTLLDYPAVVDRNATLTYTDARLVSSVQELGETLREQGFSPTVSLATDGVDTSETDVLVTTFDYLADNPVEGSAISVDGGTVSLPGYESDTTGIVVIHAVENAGEVDLIVAGDDLNRASRGTVVLQNDNVLEHAISERTAIVQTGSAAASGATGGNETSAGDG